VVGQNVDPLCVGAAVGHMKAAMSSFLLASFGDELV